MQIDAEQRGSLSNPVRLEQKTSKGRVIVPTRTQKPPEYGVLPPVDTAESSAKYLVDH